MGHDKLDRINETNMANGLISHSTPLAHKHTKMSNDKLDIINEPRMAESYMWNELGWDESGSCRTSCFGRPQSSHLAGQCRAPVENVRSQYQNNAGN